MLRITITYLVFVWVDTAGYKHESHVSMHITLVYFLSLFHFNFHITFPWISITYYVDFIFSVPNLNKEIYEKLFWKLKKIFTRFVRKKLSYLFNISIIIIQSSNFCNSFTLTARKAAVLDILNAIQSERRKRMGRFEILFIWTLAWVWNQSLCANIQVKYKEFRGTAM